MKKIRYVITVVVAVVIVFIYFFIGSLSDEPLLPKINFNVDLISSKDKIGYKEIINGTISDKLRSAFLSYRRAFFFKANSLELVTLEDLFNGINTEEIIKYEQKGLKFLDTFTGFDSSLKNWDNSSFYTLHYSIFFYILLKANDNIHKKKLFYLRYLFKDINLFNDTIFFPTKVKFLLSWLKKVKTSLSKMQLKFINDNLLVIIENWDNSQKRFLKKDFESVTGQIKKGLIDNPMFYSNSLLAFFFNFDWYKNFSYKKNKCLNNHIRRYRQALANYDSEELYQDNYKGNSKTWWMSGWASFLHYKIDDTSTKAMRVKYKLDSGEWVSLVSDPVIILRQRFNTINKIRKYVALLSKKESSKR